MARNSDVRVRWLLELVDKATRPMLAADRQTRRSVEQTERLHKRAGTVAERAGRQATDAATRAARATRAQGDAADDTAGDLRALSAAQAKALAQTSKALAAQARLTTAYHTTASAARKASAAQRAAANVRSSGSQALDAAGGVGGRLGGVVGPAVAGAAGFSAVKVFAGFEEQMDKVQAVAGATGGELGKMTELAKALGSDTAFSAREAAAGMYELSTAGFSAKEVIKTIPGTLSLAAASGVELADAAALQGTALRGFQLDASKAQMVADVLAKAVNSSAIEMSDLGETLPYVASTAVQTGTSFKEVAAATAILGNAGIKGSSAGTALRASMLRLTDPSKKMVNVMASMGIEAKDLAAQPLPVMIGRVAAGLKKLPNRAAKVGALSAIFGQEAAPAMLNLMAKGRKGIDDVTKALDKSKGQAEKTAKVMRSNLVGAWDEFTGAAETAAIKLVERFSPAMQDALKVGGKGLTNFVGGLTGEVKGSTAKGTPRGVEAGAMPAQNVNAAAKAGELVKSTVQRIGAVASTAGKMLVDAFKPAEPFFRNVLLPLFVGIGKGVLGSVVGAFKVLTAVIKIVATGLGWLGERAAPLKGVFEGIGTVIGFVFAGPILKGVALIGKLGSVFKYLGVAINIARVPIRILTAGFTGLGALAGKIGGWLVKFLAPGFATVGRAASKAGSIVAAGFKLWLSAHAAVAKVLIPGIVALVSRVAGAAKGVVSAVTGPIRSAVNGVRSLAGKFLDAGKNIGSKLVQGVKGIGGQIVNGIVSGISAAPGAIADAIRGVIPDRLERFIPGLRGGGRIGRYQAGGRVPILAAGGELYVENGRAMTVPGDPRSDSTLLMARPGAKVLTGHGQAMMAAGASLADALRHQMPHFAAGGRVSGLLGDGFDRGRTAGQNGESRASLRSTILGEQNSAYTWRNKARAKSSSSSDEPAGAGGVLARMNAFASTNSSKWPRYVYGGGHGPSFPGGPYDCSGFVTAILHAGGLISGSGTTDTLKGWGKSGEGRQVTVGVRGSTGRNAHTMIRVGGNYWEAGSSGVGKRSGWSGAFPIKRHPAGYRAGGNVTRMRSLARAGRLGELAQIIDPRVVGQGLRRGGEVLTSTGLEGAGAPSMGKNLGTRLGSAAKWVAGSMARLDAAIGHAAEGRIEGLRATVTAQIKRGGKPKDVQRLRAVLDLIDAELGRRVGRLERVVDNRTAAGERAAAAADRAMRTAGVDSSSSAGNAAALATEKANAGVLSRNLNSLQAAQRIAQKAGRRDVARELGTRITELNEAIAESATRQVELVRETVRARAQEGVDAAQRSTSLANLQTTAVEIGQRLNRTSDSPEGMRERAAAINGAMIPALEAQRVAVLRQVEALQSIGDTTGAAGAWETFMDLGNQVSTAVADAGDLIRDAAARAAENVVSAAAHSATMADIGMRRLELEQRLAGTFDGGGQSRADYITNVIVPALTGELEALRKQAAEAGAQGNTELARQIAEAIGSKQNDVMQAQLDALETIASAATERRFGGTLGFAFSGDTLTDSLVMAGNGS